jgi:hypothetical protein
MCVVLLLHSCWMYAIFCIWTSLLFERQLHWYYFYVTSSILFEGSCVWTQLNAYKIICLDMFYSVLYTSFFKILFQGSCVCRHSWMYTRFYAWTCSIQYFICNFIVWRQLCWDFGEIEIDINKKRWMMVLSIRERHAIFLQIWTSSQLFCYLYELTNIHMDSRGFPYLFWLTYIIGVQPTQLSA